MMNGTDNETAYEIPAYLLPELNAKIAKINRRAAKLGMAPVSYDDLGRSTRRRHPPRSVGHQGSCYVGCGGYDEEVAHVLPVGEPVRLEGWTLLAALDHDAVRGQVFLRKAPGVEEDLPHWAREVEPGRCDHCNTRRKRRDTFLLRHEDGREQVVGRQCLRDFLSGYDPDAAIKTMRDWRDLLVALDDPEERMGGRRAREFAYPAELVLTAAAMLVRTRGFVSRKASAERDIPPTGATAWWLVAGPFGVDRIERDEHEAVAAQIREEDRETARRIIWWAGENLWNAAGLSDYQYNVRLGLAAPVTRKTVGTVASAIVMYRRATEQEQERKARPESRYLGEVGAKIDVEGDVVTDRCFDNDWGTTNLIKVDTGDGGKVVWFASRVQDVRRGDRVRIRGTVKKLDTYRGEKQTVVTRAKIEKRNEGDEE